MERIKYVVEYNDLDVDVERSFITNKNSNLEKLISEFDGTIDDLFAKLKPIKGFKMTKSD